MEKRGCGSTRIVDGVKTNSADPNIEETKNQVAVKRGPLVYCLESTDLQKDISINDIVIPQNIELKPSFDANLLEGVVVLEGEAEKLQKEDWSNQLYKPLNKQTPEKTNIKLIPYYAWSNRGVNDMTV